MSSRRTCSAIESEQNIHSTIVNVHCKCIIVNYNTRCTPRSTQRRAHKQQCRRRGIRASNNKSNNNLRLVDGRNTEVLGWERGRDGFRLRKIANVVACISGLFISNQVCISVANASRERQLIDERDANVSACVHKHFRHISRTSR